MDELVEILKANLTGIDEAGESWTIENTGAIVRLKGTSKATFDSSAEAVEESHRIVTLISGTDHLMVNRAEIGAACDALYGDGKWRGKIYLCVWAREDLGPDHRVLANSLPD